MHNGRKAPGDNLCEDSALVDMRSSISDRVTYKKNTYGARRRLARNLIRAHSIVVDIGVNKEAEDFLIGLRDIGARGVRCNQYRIAQAQKQPERGFCAHGERNQQT